MEDTRKDIRFTDGRHNELFRIKDGDSIKFTAHDGETKTLKCRHIDDHHVRVIGKHGNNDYHVHEFAGKMERAGNRYEAIPGQEPVLDVIAEKHGGTLRDVTIPMTETALRELVSGEYDTRILHVEGQGMNGRHGPQARGAILRGKDGIAVLGIGGDGSTLTSLHPYWAQKYKRELSPAERAAPLAETLSGRMAEARSRADGHNKANAGKEAPCTNRSTSAAWPSR